MNVKILYTCFHFSGYSVSVESGKETEGSDTEGIKLCTFTFFQRNQKELWVRSRESVKFHLKSCGRVHQYIILSYITRSVFCCTDFLFLQERTHRTWIYMRNYIIVYNVVLVLYIAIWNKPMGLVKEAFYDRVLVTRVLESTCTLFVWFPS